MTLIDDWREALNDLRRVEPLHGRDAFFFVDFRTDFDRLFLVFLVVPRGFRCISRLFHAPHCAIRSHLKYMCEMMVCGTRMLEIHHFYFFYKSVVDMF